ncbi:Ribonuclease Z [Patescibacteria group bacterium]|nr:Ribonuclease Z [Patescibacteria group bacterium]
MNILFLGTSSGTPTKTRNVTGIALLEETGSGWYLIDCGEGTQHQLLQTSLSLNDLQAIFITHVHGDHCYGLLGLLASAGLNGRKTPLPIIAPQGVEAWFNATQQYTQLFLPFELSFVATESLGVWQYRHLQIEAIELSHRVPSFAYSFKETHLEPSLNTEKLLQQGIPQGALWGKLKKGFDVEYQGKTLKSSEYLYFPYQPRHIVIAGDNDQPELLTDICRHCHVLVHEATYTTDVANKVGDKVGHSSAAMVATFAETIKLPHLVLTHFSARYQQDTQQSPSIADIQQEATEKYTGQLFIAEDFARYHLNKKGELTLSIQQQ